MSDLAKLTDYALSIEDASISFGELKAVDTVSLQLAVGERHALIGPNGAGKSTFVGLVTGTLRPDGGRILLGGRDVSGIGFSGRVKRGLVRTFQVTSLFSEMCALDSVALAIAEREGKTARMFRPLSRYGAVQDEALDILAQVGLADVSRRPVSELAYGQQRVVEIAIALASRPRVLVLDEPAAGIPAGESTRLFEVLERLPGDVSLLFVEHDMHLVRRFAQKVTVLAAGKILARGTPQQVAANPLVQDAYLGRRGADLDA